MNMEIIKQKNKIIILNPTDFNAEQIVSCGQIFRYQISQNRVDVFSANKMATILTEPNRVSIVTDDVEYFYNFFDLNTDYSAIKSSLSTDEFLRPAIKFGYGIRILNNDAFEMIISFIISANNNIKRIQKSIEFLCARFGKNMGDYFAFPTLVSLKTATVQDYIEAGLGYRASQMYETVQKLTEQDIVLLKQLPQTEQEKFLLSLKGVGEKVKNCIMLFGLGAKNVFPVDTWINKVYNDLTNTKSSNRHEITKYLCKKYGALSGYAQQYVFYYYRSKKV